MQVNLWFVLNSDINYGRLAWCALPSVCNCNSNLKIFTVPNYRAKIGQVTETSLFTGTKSETRSKAGKVEIVPGEDPCGWQADSQTPIIVDGI